MTFFENRNGWQTAGRSRWPQSQFAEKRIFVAFYPEGSSLERWDRALLRNALESEGFAVYSYEWWHLDYKDWQQYPILNLTFEQLSHLRTPTGVLNHGDLSPITEASRDYSAHITTSLVGAL